MNDIAGTPTLAAAFKQEELFPIREVSRLTGVNPVTLRAWERRYGLIQPTRTDSGHRLYSQADIEAVRSILAWIERGVAVSKVGKILAKNEAAKAPVVEPYQALAESEWGEWQAQIRLALSRFDELQLERLYGQVFATYPLAVVFADIFLPIWQDLLLRREQFGQTSEWLFLDSFLRARVLQRLQLARNPAQERVLLVAIPGHCHELELWVAGLLLGSNEWAVSVLALGQPLDELALVCEKLQPQALVLFSNHAPSAELPRQLQRLALGLGCPLALAGEAAELGGEALSGTPVACLGNAPGLMSRRLQRFLAGQLDT
ncbi:MerR family transcriptional regulator [Pseudomonas fluvialis]|uniref:MerR family transcriptional regulator n=1 Tax=Pseudomonas fluvialis TaxID=1793966 RepID=UPI0035ADF689